MRPVCRSFKGTQEDTQTLVGFLSALLGGERCGQAATWETPCGPRCDAHAEELFAAASDDRTLLGILAGEHARAGRPVDRDRMRKASRRIP